MAYQDDGSHFWLCDFKPIIQTITRVKIWDKTLYETKKSQREVLIPVRTEVHFHEGKEKMQAQFKLPP